MHASLLVGQFSFKNRITLNVFNLASKQEQELYINTSTYLLDINARILI